MPKELIIIILLIPIIKFIGMWVLGGDRNDNLFSKKYLQETFEAFKLFSFLAVGIIGGAVLLIYILYILIS